MTNPWSAHSAKPTEMDAGPHPTSRIREFDEITSRQKAADALAAATEGMVKGGMSADDLRNFLGENGLQKTLLMLQEHQ